MWPDRSYSCRVIHNPKEDFRAFIIKKANKRNTKKHK